MGRIVMVGMKPKPGCADALHKLVFSHVDQLRELGLATDRKPIIVEAADGSIVEVFEWVSAEAIEAAHSNPDVLKLWQEYDRVCEFVPAGSIAEMGELFSEFSPLN